MKKHRHLKLVKRGADDDEPLTAVALRERLQVQAAAVTAMADEWAVRDAPVSFKDVEKALREVVFAFARIAIMLFLALREEHLVRTYPWQVEHGGRRFRRAPAISRGLVTMFGVVRYARTYMREMGADQRRGFRSRARQYSS